MPSGTLSRGNHLLETPRCQLSVLVRSVLLVLRLFYSRQPGLTIGPSSHCLYSVLVDRPSPSQQFFCRSLVAPSRSWCFKPRRRPTGFSREPRCPCAALHSSSRLPSWPAREPRPRPGPTHSPSWPLATCPTATPT